MKIKCFHYPQSFTLIIDVKLNFQCLEIAPFHIFCISFKKKFWQYIIARPNFIVWLPSLFQLLCHMRSVILCCPFYDVINLKLNIEQFFPQPKSQHKNVNISRTKRVCYMNKKAYFIISKRLQIVGNCLRLESGPFN